MTPVTGNFGYAAGERVILDESYHELRRIHLLPGNYSATPWLDGHDFILIDDNHYIVSAYLQMNVDNIPDDLTTAQNSTIVASLIQEVQDGEVIFEFCAVDYPELLYLVPITAERIGDETIADFSNTQTLTPDTVHFNSMTLAADDTLTCLLIPPPLRHSEDQPDDRRNCMDTDKSGDNRQQCQRSGCDIPCIL